MGTIAVLVSINISQKYLPVGRNSDPDPIGLSCTLETIPERTETLEIRKPFKPSNTLKRASNYKLYEPAESIHLIQVSPFYIGEKILFNYCISATDESLETFFQIPSEGL